MDISGMSEEEQLEAAMRLSLQDASSDRARGAEAGAGGGATPAVPRPSPAGPAQRAFPLKDRSDALSQPSVLRGSPRIGPSGTRRLPDDEVGELIRLLFGDSPEETDVERWFSSGFEFSGARDTSWGLWQKRGGPCGVFAPVQALLLKHLLFADPAGAAEEATDRQERLWRNSPDERQGALSHALASVLFHSTPRSSYAVCQVSQPSPAAEESSQRRPAVQIEVASFESVDGVQQCFAEALQSDGGSGAWLAAPGGVVSFICSVLLTRTIAAVKEDMDDQGTPLIGRFGHCSQDLVNLMLIGEATSNVFDGSRWLGDDPSSGLLLKGVDSDRVGVPPIGFLSELEPMRYLCVGTLFKYPEFPLWVLGSPTHYTLLFSATQGDSKLSAEAQLEQQAKKVFADHELDAGLALGANLGKMLEALGLGQEHLAAATRELVREEVLMLIDFIAWTKKSFGLEDTAGAQAGKTIKLFLYDGQDPPGPTLRSVVVETSDIDPSMAGSEGDAFTATLNTRWPNAVVTVGPPMATAAGPTGDAAAAPESEGMVPEGGSGGTA